MSRKNRKRVPWGPHVRCDECRVEGVGGPGEKCWKCPKGYMQPLSGAPVPRITPQAPKPKRPPGVGPRGGR